MGTNDATAAALILAIVALGSDSRDVFDANLNASYGLLNQLIARPYLATVQSFILLVGLQPLRLYRSPSSLTKRV